MTARPGRRPTWIASAALIAAHAALLGFFFAPAVCTPDANSYFVQARRLAEAGTTAVVQESPAQYMGPHFTLGADGRYYASQPPGLAALLAVPYRLLGSSAAFALNPLLATLSLVGLLLLGRRWARPRGAILAVALVAVNPFFNEHAHFGDAHAAVSCCLVWSLWLLAGLRSRPSAARGLAAGALLGLIPAIRYAEAAYLPAIVCFALARRRRDGRDRLALAAAAAGALAPLAALAWRNQGAYGGFWRTGYGAGPALFTLAFLGRHAALYLGKLATEGGGLTFLLGAAAMAEMSRRRGARALAWLYAGILIPSAAVYMSYFTPPDPQSMRYLLPTFSLLALASAWLLRRSPVLALSVAIVHASWGLPRSMRAMTMLRWQDAALARAADIVADDVPHGSVIIAPQPVAQDLDILGGWRLADAGLAGSGLGFLPPPPPPPDFWARRGPTLRELARQGYLRGRPDPYAGLSGEARLRRFACDVRLWAGAGRTVYWIVSAQDLERLRRSRSLDGELRRVAALPSAWPRSLTLLAWIPPARVRYSLARGTAPTSDSPQ